MLAKLNTIKTWQASLIICAIGFIVYFDGLKNQFLGDDLPQIVNNLPVHSILNIRIFFEGSTFYTGHGIVPLSGAYYRPLMTTVFSLIYTIFGPHPFYFHLFQLLLCIGSTIILYLFFRYSFKPALALFLALIFLVHPIDSQTVYEIATLQDALFFFFGILALYVLIRIKSVRSLMIVAACLFLALLAKETTVVFIAASLVYVFWYNRKRLYQYIGIMILPLALYIVLRVHAIGWLSNPNNAPIDRLSLGGRLLTAPSVMLLFITKLVFPWKLSSWYYWTYPVFSIRHTLLPLVIDLLVIALAIYIAIVLRHKASKAAYYTYLFFSLWTLFGLLLTLQITPLDMTASETWFYFPMVGVLGMSGIAISTLKPYKRLDRRIMYGAMLGLILIFGVRTAIRGTNWSSENDLDTHNVAATSGDFQSENDIAIFDFDKGDYTASEKYAQASVAAFPYATNENVLGIDQFALSNYAGAYHAFETSISYLPTCTTYDNLATLTWSYGNPQTNYRLLDKAIRNCPGDYHPWLYLALLEYKQQNITLARAAITQAYNYGATNSTVQYIYSEIMNNEPISSSS